MQNGTRIQGDVGPPVGNPAVGWHELALRKEKNKKVPLSSSSNYLSGDNREPFA